MDTLRPLDHTLINKYDSNLPRYTSYPTALQFHDKFGENSYRQHALASNHSLLPKPLSIYIHVPFCHSLCYFCGCNKLVTQQKGANVESYLDALRLEIQTRARLFDGDRLVQQIHFGGGTPNFLSSSQLSQILSEIAQNFHLDLPSKLEVGIEIDPRYIAPEAISDLFDSGFNRYSIGVQDFSPSVQKAINRLQDEKATVAVIEAAVATGASVNVDLITGLPKQSLASIEQTVNKVADCGVTRIAAYSFAYLPERIKAQKLIDPKDLPNGQLRLDLTKKVNEVLIQRGYRHIGLDHYTKSTDSLYKALLDGTLQRNFQGYTTHAKTDLVGFGVSAISSFDDAFCQNVGTVSDYKRLIGNEKIPVAKGISLNADDQLRAWVIQQLMCQGRLDLSLVADSVVAGLDETPLLAYFSKELTRLTGFVNDGILELSARHLQLTELGRYFMRPVAACFDTYLHDAKNTYKNIKQFSRAI